MPQTKRGRPKVDRPKQVRVSAYIDEDIAEIVFAHADSINQSISEYLGSIIMMHLGRYPTDDLEALCKKNQ